MKRLFNSLIGLAIVFLHRDREAYSSIFNDNILDIMHLPLIQDLVWIITQPLFFLSRRTLTSLYPKILHLRPACLLFDILINFPFYSQPKSHSLIRKLVPISLSRNTKIYLSFLTWLDQLESQPIDRTGQPPKARQSAGKCCPSASGRDYLAYENTKWR